MYKPWFDFVTSITEGCNLADLNATSYLFLYHYAADHTLDEHAFRWLWGRTQSVLLPSADCVVNWTMMYLGTWT